MSDLWLAITVLGSAQVASGVAGIIGSLQRAALVKRVDAIERDRRLYVDSAEDAVRRIIALERGRR
jgi:hypothetical protein